MIWSEIKSMLRRPSLLEAIAKELNEAEFALLSAESGVEYAMALVTYNKARIKRLKACLIKASP